jgi:hypothetical protein
MHAVCFTYASNVRHVELLPCHRPHANAEDCVQAGACRQAHGCMKCAYQAPQLLHGSNIGMAEGCPTRHTCSTLTLLVAAGFAATRGRGGSCCCACSVVRRREAVGVLPDMPPWGCWHSVQEHSYKRLGQHALRISPRRVTPCWTGHCL